MRESINTGHCETGRTSHTAVRLVKLHRHDWVILFVLLILDRVLARLDPFNRFIGEYMLDDLRYPMKEDTVPSWALLVISIICPLIFIISIYLKKKNLHDMHHAVLGLLYSVLLSAIITDGVKDAVGRPRPDFFGVVFQMAMQFFFGVGIFALYIAGKIRIFDHKGHIFKLAIVFLPLAVATYVGLSRVNDYKHHWQDVFAGALLGLSVATFCYRQFFPPLYDENCMHPYSAQPLSREAQNPVSQSSIPVNGTVADVELGRIDHPSN